MGRFLFLLALAGCAPTLVWSKRGARDGDFERDRYDCRRESKDGFVVNKSTGATRSVRDQRMFDECMEARGWRLVERDDFIADRQPSAPPPPPPSAISGFTGDACDTERACRGTRECVDGRCSESR